VCYVVDLMAGLSLQPLFDLLTDEHTEKLVHAPSEDLRVLHGMGCFPKNLFDTEVVARLLNEERTSQAALLEQAFGRVLSKGQQRSNWLVRPLTEAQIQYAAADVVWLHQLKGYLMERAAEKGILSYVQDEQVALNAAVFTQEASSDFLKPGDRKMLSPWQQYVLNGLLAYRDGLARNLGRPPYQLIPEELLRTLAIGEVPSTPLSTYPGIHPRIRQGEGARGLEEFFLRLQAEADANGLSKQKESRPRFTPAQQAAQRKAAHDKEHLFLPIKEALRNRLGVHATQLVLSDRVVSGLVNGTTRFSDLPKYRQTLFLETAEELGLDLSRYSKVE
jgi:ribonuclease D